MGSIKYRVDESMNLTHMRPMRLDIVAIFTFEPAPRPVRANALWGRLAVKKSGGQGGRRGQRTRGRLEREAGRAGSSGFGYGTARRTSAARLSSRRPS